MFKFERIRQPLAPRSVFLARVGRSLALSFSLISVSLAAGVLGYHHIEHEGWLDAFANASMILSGMGPLGELHTDGGKVFAGLYALYSGLFLIVIAGLIAAPVLHRLLHSLHVADEDEQG